MDSESTDDGSTPSPAAVRLVTNFTYLHQSDKLFTMVEAVGPRLGVIGLGHVYEWQAEALQLENIPVVAACDKDPQKGALYSNREFVTKLEDLLVMPQVDAVLVSVPNAEHFSVAKAALLAGKHVLLEKPATSSLSELAELYTLADAHGVKLVIAFHAAFAADLEWYISNREEVDQGEKVVGFNCGFYDPYATDDELQPQARSLGGSWTDSGVNALSVVVKLLPRLQVVSSVFTPDPKSIASDLQATVDLKFPVENQEETGFGSIDTNWMLGINQKSTLLRFESGRTVTLDHSQQTVLESTVSGSERLADLSTGRPRLTTDYMGVFQDFIHHLAHRTDNRDFSMLVHRLLFDARRDNFPEASLKTTV